MRLFTVDSFTSEPFKGNPAGVCVLDKELSNESYLKIANEINYAETAFVIKKDKDYNLRWFTPKEEVDLCGHATLATAKVLFDIYKVDPVEILKFNTRSGLLTVKKSNEFLEMDFPASHINESNSDEIIDQFLEQKPAFVGIDNSWCLIELNNDQEVINLNPDLGLLEKHQQKIFIITAQSSNKKYDFISRVFAPAIGIVEDPVTGSAHCYLATYWSEKLNKTQLKAFQASERTGELTCELLNNNRVLLKGQAVIMAELKVFWKLD